MVLALVAAAARAGDPPAKKVLLIGIDGCRFDAIEYSQAKYLKELYRTGAYTDRTDTLGDRATGADTCTGPGWSTALTGVFADRHGVKDNTFRKHQLAEFPNFLRRYRAARPGAATVALLTWKEFDDHLFSKADGGRLLVDGDKKGYEEGDRQVAKAAQRVLTEENPDVVFAYFGNVDSAGHGYGFHPRSPKYTNSIETVDNHIGVVLAALKARKTYAREDWLILVCTDHGGKGRGHSLGQKEPEVRNGFLILHGPSVRPGVIKEKTTNADVAVTALTHLGVAVQAEWKLDGRAVGLKK
jgi:predicted AlkP superfamily pyrophosphatase or phosphodiesterase